MRGKELGKLRGEYNKTFLESNSFIVQEKEMAVFVKRSGHSYKYQSYTVMRKQFNLVALAI